MEAVIFIAIILALVGATSALIRNDWPEGVEDPEQTYHAFGRL